MRTVVKIYPDRPDGSHIDARRRLTDLLSCQSSSDYHTLLNLIVGK